MDSVYLFMMAHLHDFYVIVLVIACIAFLIGVCIYIYKMASEMSNLEKRVEELEKEIKKKPQ